MLDLSFTTEDEGMEYDNNITGLYYFHLHIPFFIAYRIQNLSHKISQLALTLPSSKYGV